MSARPHAPLMLLAALLVMSFSGVAHATWSILIVDTRTGEIGIASATCLTSFDLRRWTPVMRVGRGAATAQSSVDSTGANRLRIWNDLIAGVALPQILSGLAASDGGHQSRQYGIVDSTGATLTFSGTGASQWKGGVTGESGTLFYAIQGNILTGAPVVDQAEAALLATVGDIPAKLMAAMEAARAMGGDGRCSCSPSAPTSCGAPPPVFAKSSHIAYVIVARLGDSDGVCNQTVGCANGSYFLNLNIAFAIAGDPDPVTQLQPLFAAWRASWVGRPDHHRSTVVVDPSWLPADGVSQAVATVTLRDWQGTVLAPGGHVVTPSLEPGSTGTVGFGAVVDNLDGTYSIPLTAGAAPGTAILRVVASDGMGAVRLSPSTSVDLLPCVCGDCDVSGGPPSILDALAAAQITVLLSAPTTAQMRCCDADGSSAINVLDSLVVAQFSTGIPVLLACQ